MSTAPPADAEQPEDDHHDDFEDEDHGSENWDGPNLFPNYAQLLNIDTSFTTRLFPSGFPSELLPKLTVPSALLPKPDFGIHRFLFPTPTTVGIVQTAVSDLFDSQWRSIADPFHSFIASWFNGLDLPDFKWILRALDSRIIPDNLHELGIDEGDIESIAEILHDGIPLFWVPRSRIAARLIAAPSSTARRAVIGHELPAITEDCMELLDLVSNDAYLYEADRLREAAELLLTHPAAAQSLATATLDSLMHRIARSKDAVYTLVTSGSGRTASGHEEKTREQLRADLGPRGSLALAPVRPIYQQFKPRGKQVPRTLNKHASFHRVHPFQYSKRNAAIALMLAASVLFYMSRWFDIELEQIHTRAEKAS